MTTLPPSSVIKFPEDSIEIKCYNIAESLKEYIPLMNERNRLGFNLFRYATGEGDDPGIIIRNAKIKFEGISEKELTRIISEEIEKVKS
jgi:hypothetical protein